MTFVCARCGDGLTTGQLGRFDAEQIRIACPRCDRLVDEARKVVQASRHFLESVDAETIVGDGK